MAIYINKEHPGVFCNNQPIPEPNQVEYRRDYLSEVINQQMIENRKLQQSFVHMQLSQNDWNQHQAIQYKKLNKRFNELRVLQEQQEAMEHRVIDWLEKIEDQNSILQQTINYDQRIQNELLQQVNQIDHRLNDELLQQVIQIDKRIQNELQQQVNQIYQRIQNELMQQVNQIDQRIQNELQQQITHLSQTQSDMSQQLNVVGEEQKEFVKIIADFTLYNEGIITRLEQMTKANGKMEVQMAGQSDFNLQIADQLRSIEETQKDALSRKDNHEGLMEKIMLQLDHLRSIVFERTNFLEEKVEKIIQNSAEYSQK
ncbi:hypothetical protein [Ureibacillus aquaedulcis]|uniref:Uncharacterized protein n=1 Tax=Ureibacillus aquaedulcis TaxID=3058421 RepID=A0ABT8GQ47_9BACL|nr:hypothetical protein [Ureibacillus sp. BA0131]MDN4493550.1 hypothetical protein [Ureibacillus sp. BA0131]